MKILTRTVLTAARLLLVRSFLAFAPLGLIVSGRHASFGVFALVLMMVVTLAESVVRVRFARA